ncbi:Uncharacterized protein Rs2_21481 [Raphanus sativus]|nr:Uncharacterized protein Rs2_21481 [Raphanus sativus]
MHDRVDRTSGDQNLLHDRDRADRVSGDQNHLSAHEHDHGNRDDVSYGHTLAVINKEPLSQDRQSSEVKNTNEVHSTRRLASNIVTPSRIEHGMEENVTKRAKGAPRSLAFNTLSEQ